MIQHRFPQNDPVPLFLSGPDKEIKLSGGRVGWEGNPLCERHGFPGQPAGASGRNRRFHTGYSINRQRRRPAGKPTGR
jgi:hypothetical protein